jgi:hypothetical protein
MIRLVASLIANYLLTGLSDNDSMEGLTAALSKLPELQDGMNINSVWTSPTAFKQLGEGGELKVFKLCGVELVHGWLAGSDCRLAGCIILTWLAWQREALRSMTL